MPADPLLTTVALWIDTPEETFEAGTEISRVLLPAWVRILAMDWGPAGPAASVAALSGMVVIPDGLIVTFRPADPAVRVGPVPETKHMDSGTWFVLVSIFETYSLSFFAPFALVQLAVSVAVGE